MKTITQAEYQEQLFDYLAKGKKLYNHNGFDYIQKVQDRFASYFDQYIEFCPGFNLGIEQSDYHHDLSVVSEHIDALPLGSRFYISGNHRVLTPGIKEIKDEYIEQAGKNYLLHVPNLQETEQWRASDKIKRIVIWLSLDFFKNHCCDLELLPTPLKALIEQENPPRLHHTIGEITPDMRLALQQIINCPHKGTMKRLYLQGKALELLALQLSQFSASELKNHSLSQINQSDIDCIYQARDILIRHQDNPPSSIDLAKQVGLGERKLRQGFREVFGNTIFGYWHDFRMEQARFLFYEGKMSVATVANTVGYAHLGHFSAAFKKKFGITPRECLLGEKPLLG